MAGFAPISREEHYMERLEKKVDSLCEQVGDMREDLATVVERTIQLQARFEGFANARDASCPMRPALTRIGGKADDALSDISTLNGNCGEVKGKVDTLESQWRSFKWTWIVIVGVVALISSVLGILAVTGVL